MMVIVKGNIAVGIEKFGKVFILGAVFTQTIADLNPTLRILHRISEPCVNLFSIKCFHGASSF